MKAIRLVTLFFTASVIFASCGSEQKHQNESIDYQDEQVSADTVYTSNKKVIYKLPSPIDLYNALKKNNAEHNKDFMHSTQLSSNYNTSTELSLNLGVYASDLAYCTTFDKKEDADNLFIVLKNLAENLHIPEGYNQQIIKRLDKNISNADSLYKITNNSYKDVCIFLEKNNRHDVIAQILLGAWLESNYITIKTVGEFDASNPILENLAEQSFLLENLIDYLDSLEKSKETTQLYNKLLDLHYAYSDILINPADVVMTKEQFDGIASKVIAFRTYIIN